jgi:hypothetical protein
MSTIAEKLAGKKTYIVALVAAAVAFAQSLGYPIPDFVYGILGALGLVTVRAAVAKVE